MFYSARVKLTMWYVLIIMLLSITFSTVIYSMLTREVERFERMQRFRISRQLEEGMFRPLPPSLPLASPELVNETKQNILVTLLSINGFIFFISAGLSYFLAGQTLQPIRKMIDEQNRFISDASHELRTPLTAIKSSLEVNLRDKHLTVTDAKKLMEQNIKDVDKLQSLSDSLLTLAQYEKNDDTLFKTVKLAALIQHAITQVKSIADEKEINIIFTHHNNGEISANSEAIVDLFVILLDNAIKYSFEESEVVISAGKIDGVVEVSIKDQGVGISKKDLPHIFKRFYRAENSRSKTNINGYGLGLAIACKIVESHRGTISVLSELKKGTEFKIKFPSK